MEGSGASDRWSGFLQGDLRIAHARDVVVAIGVARVSRSLACLLPLLFRAEPLLRGLTQPARLLPGHLDARASSPPLRVRVLELVHAEGAHLDVLEEGLVHLPLHVLAVPSPSEGPTAHQPHS